MRPRSAMTATRSDRDLAAAESIGGEIMLRVPGRMPGLYLIETDPKGEREFSYWRDTSPARESVRAAGLERVAEA